MSTEITTTAFVLHPSGGFALFPSGTLTSSIFVTSSTDAFEQIQQSASFVFTSPDELYSAQFIVPSQSAGTSEDVILLHLTSSGLNPQIGIGTTSPQTQFDIEEKADNSTGTRMLLKSSRTSEGAQVGDSAGSIIFAIDSSSFDNIFTTGSVAEITTVIKGILSDGNTDNMSGNIILKSSPEWVESLQSVAEFGFIKRQGGSNDSSAIGYISGSLIVGGENQQQADIKSFQVYNRSTTSEDLTLQLELDGDDFSIKTGSLDVAKTITSNGYNVVSQSGDFVTNEFIVAATPYSVTSSDALAVDSDGNLGIGTPNPEVRLHMLGEAPQTTQILMEQFNNTADAPDIRTRRYRGTSASRADVQTGDYLFRLNVHGQSGSASELYGSMRFDVDGTNQAALEWGLQTRDTAGTTSDRLKIDSSGNVTASGELSTTIKGGTF